MVQLFVLVRTMAGAGICIKFRGLDGVYRLGGPWDAGSRPASPPPMPEGNGQSGAAPLYVGTAPLIFSLDDIASDPVGNPEQHPDILPVSLR